MCLGGASRNRRGGVGLSLEKAESWDFEQPEVRQPVKASRVVVSVAFQHDDLDPVLECASRSGKKISEFIREAAMEKATGRGALVFDSGSKGVVWFSKLRPNITRTSGPSVELEGEEATTHG